MERLSHECPYWEPLEDLQLAADKMRDAQRRNFQVQMALKYCSGNAQLTETVFGWGRNNVELGLAENRTRIICIGAQADLGGAKLWSERFPQAAETWRHIPHAHVKPRP